MNSVELLKQLIGFETISYNSNLELITFVRDYLAAHGVTSELIHDSDGRKANLFATIGPSDRGGVALSGHTDVVPVAGQPWSVDPFVATERDGRIYGRGAADMKGYLACMLAAVPGFCAADLQLPVHLCLSYDEETGCIGVRSLIRMLEQRPHRPLACVVGEPTGLQPVLQHKGKLGVRCRVRGAPCHSAHAPRGVNAIEYAARLITRLGTIRDRLAEPARHDTRFDPPFSTVHTGVIRGGRALNIVPAECEFDWEVRPLPDFDPQAVEAELKHYADTELMPRMQAVERDTGIDFEPLQSYPGMSTEADSRIAELITALTGRADFGTVAYGTEGGLFNRAGMPTVVCGPGFMDQGHKPDEYIAIAQLEACDALMQHLTRHLAESSRL